jgi:hypothetical protein
MLPGIVNDNAGAASTNRKAREAAVTIFLSDLIQARDRQQERTVAAQRPVTA